MIDHEIVRKGQAHPIITVRDAERAGLKPLTHPYSPLEYWMMDNTIRDAVRVERKFAIVRENAATPHALSIWVA